jgi:heme/copper-type cytochrome/quinol oxidase subunit 2
MVTMPWRDWIFSTMAMVSSLLGWIVMASSEQIWSHKAEWIGNLPLELSWIIIMFCGIMWKMHQQYSKLTKMMVRMKESV